MPHRLPQRDLCGIYFSDMIKILAEKDGRRHEFALEQWAAFPEHKYGWVEVPLSVPNIVAESLGAEHKKGKPGPKGLKLE